MTLVDDHQVLALLVSGAGGAERYATTCSWWWRLASALSANRGGALSRRVIRLEPAARRAIVSTISRLRDHLTILDIRELIPAMSALSRHHPVNQLAAEAIAAADVLGAAITVGIDAPQVRTVAAERGISYRVT